MVVLTILVAVQFEQGEEKNTLVVSSQADRIAMTIVDSAEEVYYLGEPAMTTIKIFMPTNVFNVTIFSNYVLFRITTASGISDIVRYSSVNITGNISNSQGIKHIKIQAKGEYVCIMEEGLAGC